MLFVDVVQSNSAFVIQARFDEISFQALPRHCRHSRRPSRHRLAAAVQLVARASSARQRPPGPAAAAALAGAAQHARRASVLHSLCGKLANLGPACWRAPTVVSAADEECWMLEVERMLCIILYVIL